jgi:hypothetical protein
MQVGDVVRNRNAHPSMHNSRGVFLGMVTKTDDRDRWKIGGIVEEEFYLCAKVWWYGDRKPSEILPRFICVEVPPND